MSIGRKQGNAEAIANALDPSTWAMRVLRNFLRSQEGYEICKSRKKTKIRCDSLPKAPWTCLLNGREKEDAIPIKEEDIVSIKTLVVMVGLPRSGKTTWAKQHAMVHSAPIVCPDAIRLALHGQRYIQLAEPFIWAIAPLMVRALFLAGHRTVIVDGCHVSRKRRDAWKPDFTVTGWQLMFKHIDTGAQVCIERAKALHDEEIIPIIEKMSDEFEHLEVDEMPLVEYLGAPGDPAAVADE